MYVFGQILPAWGKLLKDIIIFLTPLQEEIFSNLIKYRLNLLSNESTFSKQKKLFTPCKLAVY